MAVHEAAFVQALGYFGALQHMLTFSLGWTRHDKGLVWWYDAGRPVDDPRLRLLSMVWEADGHLLRYLKWWVAKGSVSAALGELGYGADKSPLRPDREWQERLRLDDRERAAIGGGDPTSPWGKHLEGGMHVESNALHSEGEAESAPIGRRPHRLVEVDEAARRATLICDAAGGWYRALDTLGSSLPPLKNRNWHLDVWVKPYGFVGTYRKSQVTGLWFAGKHRYHSVGN